MEIEQINGKWTLILGEIKITANSKESLESLVNSWRDDIPNCSHCDYTPCRCSKENK
jgi:hypothetical protein